MAFKTSDIRALGPQLGQGIGHTTVEGLSVVEDNLITLMNRMARAGAMRVKHIADRVLEESKNLVPYDEGKLFNTGKVVHVKELKRRFINLTTGYYVSYGDASLGVNYALYIHETPETDDGMGHGRSYNRHPERWPSGYPGPKMWKYLEYPAENAKTTMLGEVQEDVKEAVIAVIQEVRSMKPRLIKKGK